MCTNKNAAIADFVNRVIKNSWTFDRLIPQEREQVLLLLANIHSAAKTPSGVSSVVNKAYSEFLHTVGYKPIGWRESRTDVPLF